MVIVAVVSVIVFVATIVSTVLVAVVRVISVKDSVSISVSVLTMAKMVVFLIDVPKTVDVTVVGYIVVVKRLEQSSLFVAIAEAHWSLHSMG